MHNRRNADKDSILLDNATIESLKDFNESCFELLSTFKGILVKEKTKNSPTNKFSSLEEFVSSCSFFNSSLHTNLF